jgi:nucleoside 2-deoxyribosyltransferase
MGSEDQMLVYLAGSIEFSPDQGKSWRKMMRAFIENELGHEVYDPAEDDKKNLSEEERANFRLWKDNEFDRYRKVVRKIIDFDLDLIENRVDYIVCLWTKQSAQGGGTPAELTLAYRKRIPVYLVTEVPYEDMSGWVLSCAEHVFRDFDSLKAFLASAIHSGTAEKLARNAHV